MGKIGDTIGVARILCARMYIRGERLINLQLNGFKFVTLAASTMLLAGCSQGSTESSVAPLLEAVTGSDPIDCLLVENTENQIEENVASFTNDPTPTDLWVYPQFRYSNNCDQDVIGLKGNISFQNVVGDEIFSGDWTEDATIPVGYYFDSDPEYGFEFNEFEDAHGLLIGIDSTKTRAVFTVETLVFEDGTQLSR